jgi:cell filamentation protein
VTEGYDAFDDPYAYPAHLFCKTDWTYGMPVFWKRSRLKSSRFALKSLCRMANSILPHYCSIHHHLFQDVYEWAGQYRTVRTTKGGNAFCYPEHIPAQMGVLFRSIRGGEAFAQKSRGEFLREAARFLGEMNAIHPFREGNGRAQLAFLGLIGTKAGHPFAFERIDRNAFLQAMIESFLGKFEELTAELGKLLN